MADIPQEVRETAAGIYQRFRDHDMSRWVLNGRADTDSVVQDLHAMFLAGKRAGAEEEKRHQDFITATAYECGHKAGMERAAEIAENSTVDWLGDDCCIDHAHDIAQAIRSENDGHG